MDWRAWHADYEDPDSALGRRLALVRTHVCAAVDRAPLGPVHAISVCAGQGQDLIGALAAHPRRGDVTARLVELDADNAQLARGAAHASRLDGVQVLTADAATTDAYAGAVPAEVVLVCGVFGNIADADIATTIDHLPRLCAAGATVIWTRHRQPPDVTPHIRETFARAGFEELAFESCPPFGVGVNRLRAAPLPFAAGVRLFEFVGYDVLRPDFHASQSGVPGAARG